MAKVIITCAVTGGAHTPSMSDALPVTPDEIATQAIDAAEAGAAILHLHARVPETGQPTADRLFGRDAYQWSVLAAGRHQMPFLTQAALMGGHVRVGLEDSLFIERGVAATSNAQQVAKIVRILAEMGHEPATPTEARAMLGLKGGDRVEF